MKELYRCTSVAELRRECRVLLLRRRCRMAKTLLRCWPHANFVGTKEDLQKKASKGGGSDLEEFMALEKIREHEEQLKQIMTLVARFGEIVEFQAKARVARRQKTAIRKRKQYLEIFIITFLLILGLTILACIVLLAYIHKEDFNGLQGGLRMVQEDWRDVATGNRVGVNHLRNQRKYPACRPAATAAKSKKDEGGNP